MSNRIAIVGGGMVGASLALLLSRALPKFSIVLLEAQSLNNIQDPLPSFDARSTALAPGTQQILQQLGLWGEITSHATAIDRIRVSDSGHPGCLSLGPEDNHGDPLGYVVENRGLGLALNTALTRCPNIEVRAPILVQGIQPQARGVVLRLLNQPALSADLVIVADGADSPLRKQLGIGERVHDYYQSALVANVQHQSPHKGRAFERFTRSGPLALLPLGGSRGAYSSLVWTLPEAQAQQCLALSDAEFLRALQIEFGYRLGHFVHATPRLSYPLKLRIATEQVRSGVVLLGNAAHFLHPVAGQGFNLALRDATRLAEVLRQAPEPWLGDLQVLSRYLQGQERDQWRTILLSHSFNQIFRYPSPVVSGLRTLGLGVLAGFSPVRDGFIRQLSGRAERRARPFSLSTSSFGKD